MWPVKQEGGYVVLTNREIRKSDIHEFGDMKELLTSLQLGVPDDIEYTVGLYDDENLVGAGSLVGNIIQGVAVLPSRHGEGLSSKIITVLVKKAMSMGRKNLFVFTKTSEAGRFEGLGFRMIASVKDRASLLEWGYHGIDEFKRKLGKLASGKPENASSVVVNCNPFTNGHRYLIERAAEASPWLYVIVVREDRSLFPFDVRMDLVEKGVADLDNVTVLSGGDYVISNLTFPSYFTRDDNLTPSHATLDLTVFGKHIAPSLKVVRRFVGEEPYCPVTSTYNVYMKKVLPEFGILVEEIPRLEADGTAVSASAVRQYIRDDRMDDLEKLVPRTTFDFLVSREASGLVEKIRSSMSRH